VPFADVETTRGRIEGVREASRAAGRDPQELVYSHAVTVCCAEEEAELEHRAARIGREVEDLRRSGAAGTPSEVAARLEEYRAAGASRSYLQVIDFDDLDHIALIASEVMPLVAGG
jgi:alkanesulfonate monooxygenase